MSNTVYEFAERVKSNFDVKAIMEIQRLYIYDEGKGYFVSYGKNTFSGFLFYFFYNPNDNEKISESLSNAIFYRLSHDPELQITLDDFNSADENLLNVKNGVLDIATLEFKEHSSDYMFDYCLDVKFKSDYKKPKMFLEFLKQCFSKNEEDMERCLECLAYLLSNNKSAKKIWGFVGEANTGKSMLISLLTRIIGKRFVTSITLKRLESKFDLKSALHCRLNVISEISNLYINEAETLKMISGNDEVRVEGKYEPAFDVTLNIKFLLAGNHLPRLSKNTMADDGIKNRLEFIGFYNPVPQKQRISNYDKILFNKEGNEIFSLLMEVLHCLHLKKYEFTRTKSSEKLAEEFNNNNKNSIELFVEERCHQISDEKIAVSDLYKTYEEYCDDNDLTVLSKKEMCKYIEKLPSRPRKKKARIKGKENPVQVMFGVTLSNDLEVI